MIVNFRFFSTCSNVIELRKAQGDAFAKAHGIKLGFMSPFVKASAYALMDQPVVNAVIDGQDVVYRDYVDISVAVATPKVCKLIFRDHRSRVKIHASFSISLNEHDYGFWFSVIREYELSFTNLSTGLSRPRSSVCRKYELR